MNRGAVGLDHQGSNDMVVAASWSGYRLSHRNSDDAAAAAGGGSVLIRLWGQPSESQ